MTPSPPSAVEKAAWALFDVAISPFNTLMITVFFGRFFEEHVVPRALAERSHTLWALTISTAMALVALSSPVVGAIADHSGRKKPLLAAYVLACALATAAIAFVSVGTTTGMLAAMLAMIVANTAFEGGYVFYNAFLPELAASDEAGRLSGLGWAIGYVGGLASLAIVLLARWMPDPSAPSDRWRAIPLLVACWYVLFALPTLLLVRERAPRRPAPPEGWTRQGLRGVRDTLRALDRYPDLRRFLLAYLLFTDALETVLVFTAIFSAKTLGFTHDDNAKLFLILNVCAIPGALVFGRLVDRWGGVKSVATTLMLWLIVVAGCIVVQSKLQFLGIAVIAALGVGGTQAAARAVVSRYVPAQESGRIFGFMTLAGRASAVVGPLVYGLVADLTGSIRAAVATISLFFLGGLALLTRVDEARALARAREASTLALEPSSAQDSS